MAKDLLFQVGRTRQIVLTAKGNAHAAQAGATGLATVNEESAQPAPPTAYSLEEVDMCLGPWERMASRLRVPSPVELLHDARLRRSGVYLFLKRDDLIHREVSGNKWRKLKYNIIEAARQDYHTLLTLGSAKSGGRWTATAKFGQHDQLEGSSAGELLEKVRGHYRAHGPGKRQR